MEKNPSKLSHTNEYDQVLLTPPRRLRLAEWAKELGISRTTIWNWTVRHGLKVSRIGRLAFVDERDIDAFMKRHAWKPYTKMEVGEKFPKISCSPEKLVQAPKIEEGEL